MAVARSWSLSYRVFAALHGRGQDSQGAPALTGTQKVSAVLIVASVVAAILGTEPLIRDRYQSALEQLELGFAVAFCAEYLLRVWSAGHDPRFAGLHGRLRYALTSYALLDLLSLIPFFSGWGAQSFLLRVLRLFRLLRYSEAMRFVLGALYQRRFELAFSVALSAAVILLTAGALYSIEGEVQPEIFGSVPRALWWSISTLTTVGYGDAVPITPLGKVFAALTAVSGIGLIAMPAGILASAFSDAFRSRDQAISGRVDGS